MMRLVVLIFILSFYNNSFAGKLIVDSTPSKSDIFIVRANGTKAKIGQTPYSGDLNSIMSQYVSGNGFMIVLSKKGYQDYRVLMAKSSNVDMKLSANLMIDDSVKMLKKYDAMISQLFDAQRLIRSRNYNDAISKLDDLEKKYSGFSIIPELKGMAYYLSKDIEKSLSHFRRAFSVNSSNLDAYKMKVYLEKKLGVDTDKF